jgi:hypothetical protein
LNSADNIVKEECSYSPIYVFEMDETWHYCGVAF